jgi:threonyl-tRNA synthetase
MLCHTPQQETFSMSREHDASYRLRHSAAHLLAHAITHLFPGTKLTIGPVTQEGFFYDILPTKNLKERDLAAIEAKMHELSKANYPIEGEQVSKDVARKVFADNPFKLEIIDSQIKGDTAGVYTQGDFTDLCAGGHTGSTGDVKYFKLTALSGSYWRADRSGTALQRVSGVVFPSQEELDGYFARIEEAKKYDHRHLGKQHDLFSFSDLAPGMVFFHDKGTRIYNSLINFIRTLSRETFQEVRTPMMMDKSLWERSGHYANYKENMYITQIEDREHAIRPMNCPGGILLYASRPHSYRELPVRLSEFGHVHRHELSGVLHGLTRVRAFTQDDAHIFCQPEQLTDEIIAVIKMAQKLYHATGFDNVRMALSTKPDKAMGTDEQWKEATKALADALDQAGISYQLQEGEGAFYGPKIEMLINDAMGREWQCGTVQVDFCQPENFDLSYIMPDQSKKRPVMIHRALLGSVERFMAIVLEHHKGRLPFWLAPVHARVITISEKQKEYAASVANKLRTSGLFIEIDDSDEKISAKIKRAQLDLIPWMLVVGGKEAEAGTVTLRHPNGKQEFGLSVDEMVERGEKEIASAQS